MTLAQMKVCNKILVLLCLLVPMGLQAQFVLSAAGRANQSGEQTKSAKSLSRMQLPFIDDFSSQSGWLNLSMWQNSGVFLNSDYAIFAPSVGILTLDALNEEGFLYSGANTTGFSADTITSCYIRLDSLLSASSVALSAKDSIRLSFFYQPSGGTGALWESIGSTPSKKDSLVLQFYSKVDSSWNSVWFSFGTSVDSIYAKDSLYWYYVSLPITEEKYFNDSFRFRFLNYCSLDNNPSYSYVGNCDGWNLDYIYLDKNRSYADSTFNDIAFVCKAPSFLKIYQAMPARQFVSSEMATNFDMQIVNLHSAALNSIYKYEVFDQNNQSIASYNGGFENISPYFKTHSYQSASSHARPSISFAFPVNTNSYSTYKIVHTVKEGVGEDNLISNDTIAFEQVFKNYFAYDDGTAENGFGIEPIKNASLAVGFTMNAPDTLSAIDVYFNNTYNDANLKPFYLCIYNATDDGKPKDSIYHSSTYYTPTYEGLNKFVRYNLETPIVLPQGEFFVCLQTKSNDYLNIGFDRNTNSQSKIFGSWAGVWQQNTLFAGSVMLRPYFGAQATIGLRDITNEQQSFSLYPNPAINIVNIKTSFRSYIIRIRDIAGRTLIEKINPTSINVSTLKKGFYIVEMQERETNLTKTQKLIIQ